MEAIAIRLYPGKLDNPDLDLRYQIPRRLEEASGGQILDNGYDYLEDDSMVIFLQAEDAKEGSRDVWELFQKELFLGNDLSKSGEILTASSQEAEWEEFTPCFPAER